MAFGRPGLMDVIKEVIREDLNPCAAIPDLPNQRSNAERSKATDIDALQTLQVLILMISEKYVLITLSFKTVFREVQ